MARRYIGDAFVDLTYRPKRRDYAGYVRAGKHVWQFDEIRPPSEFKYGASPESPSAYDEMAKAAVSFGAYYNSLFCGKRERWAPPPEVADAIYQFIQNASDERGRYAVRRTKEGSPRWK